jgi:hypothetical protein
VRKNGDGTRIGTRIDAARLVKVDHWAGGDGAEGNASNWMGGIPKVGTNQSG